MIFYQKRSQAAQTELRYIMVYGKCKVIWEIPDYMYYNAVGNKGRGIGLITSKPLTTK